MNGNVSRITNKRGGYTWCLSAPNGYYSRVYAEVCRPNRAKQLWLAESTGRFNRLRSWNGTSQCLENTRFESQVALRDCNDNPFQLWNWS